MIVMSSFVSNMGFTPPFQIWRDGFGHEAVISGCSNSSHEFAGRMKSEYSQVSVISMSCVMIMSIRGRVLNNTPYIHFALLMMLTFVVHITFVGDGMWDLPVKIFRPAFGVSTMSAWSPWSQYAGS